MIELDTENRLSDQLGKATDGLGSKLRGEPIRGPTVRVASSKLVKVRQNSADLRNTALLLVTIELVEETIVVSGRLPSHYLKQLLQEAIKVIPGVVNIDNQVDVLWPTS